MSLEITCEITSNAVLCNDGVHIPLVCYMAKATHSCLRASLACFPVLAVFLSTMVVVQIPAYDFAGTFEMFLPW
eukprot:scaffold227172_cov23-Tisochrysis_lutea.AAC.1